MLATFYSSSSFCHTPSDTLSGLRSFFLSIITPFSSLALLKHQASASSMLMLNNWLVYTMENREKTVPSSLQQMDN